MPSFHGPIGATRRASPLLSGLDLPDSEQDRISEMFHAHATNNTLSQSSFNRFLLEGFSYSFTTRENDRDCRHHIRASLDQLPVDMSSPIFKQAWAYFDQERNGVLTLRDVGKALASVKSRGTASRFVFDLADVNQNGSLNYEELLHFFNHFIELSLVCGVGVLGLERPHLIHKEGWDMERYKKEVATIESSMIQAQVALSEQLRATFEALSLNVDGYITRSEWSKGLAHLPEMYMKVLLLCQGMLCFKNLKFEEL